MGENWHTVNIFNDNETDEGLVEVDGIKCLFPRPCMLSLQLFLLPFEVSVVTIKNASSFPQSALNYYICHFL